MKKLGFTLAEVLITLGIIGVVAALTTPALVHNVGDAKIGPTLSKFNNTFANAVNLSKERNNLTSFHRGRDAIARDISSLGQHIVMVPPDDDHPYTFTDALGQQSHTVMTNTALQKKYDEVWNAIFSPDNPNHYSITDLTKLVNQMQNNPTMNTMNDGTVMVVAPVTTNPSITIGVYKGVVGEVIVDIDGDHGNNKAGVDVFGFLLDSSGLLIPAGSAAHRTIGQSGTQFITAPADCHNGSANLNENFACTGKIADNNWSTKGISLD